MAVKIYCPVCAWRPQAHHRWMCDLLCGTSWNTFETRGRCPGCQKQWRVTQCLSCNVYSPHDEWYHEETPLAADRAADAREREEELAGVG